MNGWRNRLRAEMYFLAEFYLWEARRGFAMPGNHPTRGYNLSRSWDPLERTAARAAHLAMAKVYFAAARKYASPLPA